MSNFTLLTRIAYRWFQNFDWDGLANLTMSPPLMQPVSGPLDISNFDNFPMEMDVPVDECSGWDKVGFSKFLHPYYFSANLTSNSTIKSLCYPSMHIVVKIFR